MVLPVALTLIFTLNLLQSKATFSDAGVIRTTQALGVGDDMEIVVDDAEWSYDASQTGAGKKILLVDDDTTASGWPTTAKEPALRFMLQGLQNIGFKPDPTNECDAPAPFYWDTASAKCNSAFPNPAGTLTGAPSAATMAGYDLVIWFTGDASSTLATTEITDLTTYLGAGGDLLLASHGLLDDVASCADGVGGADVTCAGVPYDSFIPSYLGVKDYSSEARGGGLSYKRPLTFKDLSSDVVGGGQSWAARAFGGYVENPVNELTLSTAGKKVLEETDASFGTSSPNNVVITRTNDGTARVVFASNYLENAQNQADPDNFRSLFARTIKYLTDAPTVTVTNPRTGESETVSLTNNGLGVLNGSVATSASSGIAGDLVMNDLLPGDKLVTTYTEASPVAGTLSDTSIVVKTDPVTFEDSSGTALTKINVPGNFYVRVINQDANTSGGLDTLSVSVTSSSGDSESVTLTETTADSGIFLSPAIPTVLSDAGVGDGLLKVSGGGTVDLSYAYLGAEVTRTFDQTTWHGGTTDSVATIPADLSGFSERDDQINIDSDEQEYFVNDDGGILTDDWQRNDFPPNPNPIVVGNFEGPGSASDALGAGSPTVVQEPSTGDYYLWYEGTKSGTPDSKTIHLAISKKGTSPIGRDFEKQPSPTTYGPVFTLGGAGSFYECGAEDPNVVIDPAKPFGTPGHFIMYFSGLSTTTDCGSSVYHDIGRTTSADGLSWTAPVSVLTVTSPGPAWDDGRIEDPYVSLVAGTYHMWYSGAAAPFSGAYSIGYATSADGISWTKIGIVLAPSPGELDDSSVKAASVAYDSASSKYVMYYYFSNSGTCTGGEAGVLLGGIAKAEASVLGGPWSKSVAPAEQAAVCGVPGATYENIVFRSLTVFTDWEYSVRDPMLLIDPKDGIDRLYFGSPGESGDSIGVAWNVSGSASGKLHTNPLDTATAGYTTTEYGGFNLERLGHFSELKARTSNLLSDLLYDPTPGIVFPAGTRLTNGGLLGNASDVLNGQRYLQLETKIDQDTSGPVPSFPTAHSGFIFSDALENFKLDVFLRPNLTQALSLPVEVVATDAVVRITDATFTQDPQTWQAYYDINAALDQTTKTVVDANGGEVNPGDQLDYSIQVTNSSAQTIHGIKVNDRVSLGTTYLAGSIFGKGANDTGAPDLVWQIGDLAAGASETIGFSVIVDPNIGQGSEILNQAFLNSIETGVVPTDDPTTPTPRDPTILPVGAELLIWLGIAGLAALLLMGLRRLAKKFLRNANNLHRSRSSQGLTAIKKISLVVVAAIILPISLTILAPKVLAQLGSSNTMYFEVNDPDQNMDTAIKETVAVKILTFSGDSEDITLAESDINSGIFRGTMRAVLDPTPLAGNGLLEVVPFEEVTIQYVDKFNTSGSSITREDKAKITVDHLYNIALIAKKPTLLPSGGQQAQILAGAQDIFGKAAPDGTRIDFSSSNGGLVPGSAKTVAGKAPTIFSSSTIINPTLLTAQISSNNTTDTGRLSLTTSVGGISTTAKTTKTIPGSADINLPGSSGGGQGGGPSFNRPPSKGTAGFAPSAISQNIYQKIAQLLDGLEQNQKFQKSIKVVNDIVAPILAGLAALNLLLAVAATSWYPFLLRIFLEPIQILLRRKGKSWGVVYDSLTKQPIDLAIVRLYHADNNKLAGTRVTDRRGRYGFLVQPGEYYLTATKRDIEFPSRLLGQVNFDDNYPNLDYGKKFKITRASFIHKNIPVDSTKDASSKVKSTKQLISLHFKKTIHNVVAYFGVISGLLAYVYTRSNFVLVLLVLHLIVFLFFRRLARGPLIRPWGVVYDQGSRRALSHSVVRIFDTKYQRMLEQQVTDRQGRFGFLVGRAEYRLDAVKTNYVFPAQKKSRARDYLGGPIKLPENKAIVVADIPMLPKRDTIQSDKRE